MDPNSNYPPGLSPQLDPTLQQQQQSAPGLMATTGAALMGDHQARLQASDIAAGYAAGAATGALQASMRSAQAFGTASFIFESVMRARGSMDEFGNMLPGGTASRGLRAATRASQMLDPFVYAPSKAFNLTTGTTGGFFKGAGQITRGMKGTSMLYRAGQAARLGVGAFAGLATGGMYLMAQEAAIETAGSIYEGHAERMRSSTLINAVAPGSMNFTQEQARSANMGGMAKGMGMEFDEFAQLTSMLGQTGSFNGVSSLQEFKSKLRQSLTQLKEIASVTNSTLQEAGQIGVMLSQQGFSGGQLPAAAAQAFGIGQATGLGAAQVVQMGAIGAQYGAQTNIGQTVGSNMFQQSLGSMEFAMQRGAFSNEMIQRMGGTSSSATLQLMQGTMGQAGMLGTTVSQMMGYIAKKGEGEYSAPTIDKAKLEKLLNGGVSRQELAAVSQTQQVLGMSSPIQREAMPQIGQALHATLSQGTSNQEEYLRKAEMMGIQPDVALALRETERSRGLMTASARLEARNNALEASAARSVDNGFELDFGISRGLSNYGKSISRDYSKFTESLLPSEPVVRQSTTADRQRLFEAIRSNTGSLDLATAPGEVTNAPIRGEGSGNPFFAGAGELKREALLREFGPLFRTNEQDGSIFGESTFSTFRASKSAIDEAVRHRAQASRDVTELAKAEASLLADSGAFDRSAASLIEEQLGIGQFDGVAGGLLGMATNAGGQRDSLGILATAKKLGIGNPNELQAMAEEIRTGKPHSAKTGAALMRLKNRIHATGQAINFDFSSIVGSDITGASDAGALDAAAIRRKGDKAAAELVASFGKRDAYAKLSDLDAQMDPFGIKASINALFPEDDFVDNDLTVAAEGLFSTENRGNTLAMLSDIRKEMDRGYGFAMARQQVEAARGLTGADLRLIQKMAEDPERYERIVHDMNLQEFRATYHDIADPVAADVRNAVFDHFGNYAGGDKEFEKSYLAAGFGGRRGQSDFVRNLRSTMDTAGQRGTSPQMRRTMMETLLTRSYSDGSLSDEIGQLEGKEGLEGVTNIFNTIDQLMKGSKVEGFETKERTFEEALEAARKKGILDIGLVGDAAEARAGAGDKKRASLGGDLLSFSRSVETLANTVNTLADKVDPKAKKDGASPAVDAESNSDGEQV